MGLGLFCHPLLSTQSNTLQKKISSHFFSNFFHLPYFTSKQTLPKEIASPIASKHDLSPSFFHGLNPLNFVGVSFSFVLWRAKSML